MTRVVRMLTVSEHNRQILIIEDDADTAEMVTALLETAGYSAIAVDSGEVALNEIKDTQPDLVLLDMMLPDVSGLDLLKQMRAKDVFETLWRAGVNQLRN